MPAIVAQDLPLQWTNRRARATDGHDSTKRKLGDEHEGTAGRSPQSGMRNHSASCGASAPTPGSLFQSPFSSASRAGQFSSGSLPTHQHERAARTATPQRRSSHREGSGVRPLHLAAAWRRWHGRCAVWRRRRRRIGWHGAPGVPVEPLHADQPRRRRGRGGRTGRSAPRQRLGSGRRALHAVVGRQQRDELVDALHRNRRRRPTRGHGCGGTHRHRLQRRQRVRDQQRQQLGSRDVPLRHRERHHQRLEPGRSAAAARDPGAHRRRPFRRGCDLQGARDRLDGRWRPALCHRLPQRPRRRLRQQLQSGEHARRRSSTRRSRTATRPSASRTSTARSSSRTRGRTKPR